LLRGSGVDTFVSIGVDPAILPFVMLISTSHTIVDFRPEEDDRISLTGKLLDITFTQSRSNTVINWAGSSTIVQNVTVT
jgi:hypothetical protein